LAAVVFLTGEPSARASTPVSIYTAASRVDMLPSDALASEVVIHGAFMFVNSSGGYSDAACGVMYFRCPSGSETMCRMQWLDIRTMGTGTSQCAGFGAQNVVSTARVRDEGAALTAPDTWELGLGVQPGSYIDGKCAPAKTLACAQPSSSDGGTADVSLSSDARVTGDGQGAGLSGDLSGSSETGLREAAGSESASAIDASADRASSPLDAAEHDAALARDVPIGTVVVDGALLAPDRAPSVLDARADRSTGTPDASPDAVRYSVSDADDGPSPKSDGCGCHVGGRPAGSRAPLPAGLALFAALTGLAVLRRARR
jgi:hypothetical protein